MKITNRIVEAYLTCEYKARLLLKGKTGTVHDYETLIDELVEEHRPRATEALLMRLKIESAPTISSITVDDLKQGHLLILDCAVETEQFHFHFDGLKKVDGKSSLGAFHYSPVLFHHDDRVRENTKIALACGAVVLASVQKRVSEHGSFVIGQPCKVSKAQFGKRSRTATRVIDDLTQIIDDAIVPQMRLKRNCDVCEFRDSCQAEAIEKDDLSLLRGMSDAEIDKHKGKGIFTVHQLSYTFRPRRQSRRGKSNNRRRQFALQALAIRENKVFVLDSPQLPDAQIRVYLDFEGDEARSHAYLIGYIISTDTEQRKMSLWSDDQAGEASILEQMLVDLAPLENCVIFHYGAYETDYLKAARTDDNAELIDQILARSCNVLSVIYDHVYFPAYSNSLKDIGSVLGCSWSPQIAAGSQSLLWRRRWDTERNDRHKRALLIYNQEDCLALQRITEFLYSTIAQQDTLQPTAGATSQSPEFAYVGDVGVEPNWRARSPLFPDFDHLNKCAYFDYQRERVFVRHDKRLKKRQAKRKAKKPVRFRTNRNCEITTHECPECGASRIVKKPRQQSKWAFDLIVTSSGIRRHVTKVTAPKHICQQCGLTFVPVQYDRLDRHGHAMKSWAMYQHVVHRLSTHRLEELFRDLFGLPVHGADFIEFKHLLASYYQGTYDQILEALKAGPLIHADETPVTVKTGKGYVWTLASYDNVFFMYRPNREGAFLTELLGGFDGVLVSDFYGAYDSLPCPQQKCIVHFIRDLNTDLIKNPFDDEFKGFVAQFSSLLKSIVAAIDTSGLKERVLKRYRRMAEALVRRTVEGNFRSAVMEGYRNRIEKYGDKMFTFLKHDGVPWNNAQAEHAIRSFAYYRDMSSGYLSVQGLETFLVLLSISQTCVYRDVSFLDFLLSQERSVDNFTQKGRWKRLPPELGTYPAGYYSWRHTPKRDDQPKRTVVDTEIRIRFLKRAGKTVPEITQELGLPRTKVIRVLQRRKSRKKKQELQ